jgi:uncharacterized RmlC-like cupin family protein
MVENMDWQHNGVKIVPAGELDSNTPQSPGMTRAAAITNARTGASKLWADVKDGFQVAVVVGTSLRVWLDHDRAGGWCFGLRAT